MIGPIVREMLLENQETFLIPAENVANVMYHHPLSMVYLCYRRSVIPKFLY